MRIRWAVLHHFISTFASVILGLSRHLSHLYFEEGQQQRDFEIISTSFQRVCTCSSQNEEKFKRNSKKDRRFFSARSPKRCRNSDNSSWVRFYFGHLNKRWYVQRVCSRQCRYWIGSQVSDRPNEQANGTVLSAVSENSMMWLKRLVFSQLISYREINNNLQNAKNSDDDCSICDIFVSRL